MKESSVFKMPSWGLGREEGQMLITMHPLKLLKDNLLSWATDKGALNTRTRGRDKGGRASLGALALKLRLVGPGG